ncbi:hypothetical protein AB0L86_22160 [Micromonospora musae]|uniref:hypothetical protein n=1 Tax=Micromonospora musae TaxID=1894970 RepID=UPI00343B7694
MKVVAIQARTTTTTTATMGAMTSLGGMTMHPLMGFLFTEVEPLSQRVDWVSAPV